MLFDELKSYLNGKIAEDKDLNMTIGIKEQYPYGHTPTPPELLLAIMDNTELESATTFEGETTSNVSLQIIPIFFLYISTNFLFTNMAQPVTLFCTE